MELTCDRAKSKPDTCRGAVHVYDCSTEKDGRQPARNLCEAHAEEDRRDMREDWYLLRRPDFEMPELPPRQLPGDNEAAADRLLSRVKNVLRTDGLYPGNHARAGVEWDPAQGKHRITVELYLDPNDA